MAVGNRSSRMRGHLNLAGRYQKNERVAVSLSTARRPTFRDVFRHSEFRALWVAYVLSMGGDRLALVALTLLVYDRSKSPLLAAITFAAGFLPYLFGGMFLSGLADRLPRRAVMVACDLVRCALVAAMLAPGVPLAAMIVLLYAVTLLQPPFDAARSATVRDVTDAGTYPLAMAVMGTTLRVVLVAGAAAGGLVTALAGARPALAADAATFAASALLVWSGTRPRPAVSAEAKPAPLRQLAEGTRLVFGDPRLRMLIGVSWLAAFYEVPEGIAAPYAASLKGGAAAAGLILATSQLGAALVTPAFVRRVGPRTRLRWMGPMAVLCGAVLVTTLSHPGLAASMAIFAVSSCFAAYQVAANTAFMERIPNEKRGQALGLANAGLVVGQGLGFALAGAAAAAVSPSAVVAVSGGLGALIACGIAIRSRKTLPAAGRHTARHLGRGQAPAGSLPRAALVNGGTGDSRRATY
jgi:predicted MFS family arabinose efflux permease